MGAKRKTRSHEAQLAFEALSIEGGLLSPEWLSKVAQLQAGTQTEADYRIHKGLNLRDEIGRYWRIAQAHWADFKSGRGAKADPKAISDRFVHALLRDAFGFVSLAAVPPVMLSERSYPIEYAALGGRVPVVIGPADTGFDTPLPSFGDGSRKRSVFGLAQEYLNAQDSGLWGIASDGAALRIVRDNASLTRPAWIEADLQRIFTEERYADFAALWLLCHETRFGGEGQPVTDCALEVWRNAGREEGTRAREHLRRGVEEALAALGQGFLSHAENQTLRADLQSGALAVKDYFNQLLRLVYRLIFLLTVEERGLLHPDGTSEDSKALYASGYGIRRLRERSAKRSAHDRFSDLWDATKIVSRGLAAGETRLGLPALVGIFSGDQCRALDTSKLENRALLLAVFKLAWLREDGSLSRVNWRDMGPEELGSVYESLLELVPQITRDGRKFAFATGGETKGNARKTTGSYYTPDSLVQVLLDNAVDPVITDTIAKNPGHELEALLGLSIVDPACGSGHFLLAAARRLAAHVARLQANGTPSAGEYRHALRRVVGRCIYGVDLNPMAVELCKVSLWMEAVEPGLPLTFLDSHIQHGNALLGTTPQLMAKGIPDAAWETIDGDEKQIVNALKKRNKSEAGGQKVLDLWSTAGGDTEATAVALAVADLEIASDASADALARKESTWNSILGSPEYRHQKAVGDAWCAAFLWPKQSGELADAAPTNELWRQFRDGQGNHATAFLRVLNELADQYRFFHWHLQFPQVFAKGGFDVVLGNPPWERVKLQEQEFFASRNVEVAGAANSAIRKKLVAALRESDPDLWAQWKRASREAAGLKHFLRESERFPLTGEGDVNTYALFAELDRMLLCTNGRAGFIVPTGIATDDSTSKYFSALVRGSELACLFSFENEERVFPAVHHAFKFALLTIDRSGHSPDTDFVFFARNVSELLEPERHFKLAAADLRLINPHTLTAPTFRSKRDALLTISVHRQIEHLKPCAGNAGWKIVLRRMIHMSDDAHLFRTPADLTADGWRPVGNEFVRDKNRMVPLYEAKLVHHFDHRFATYEGQTEAQSNQGKCPELGDEQHADPHCQVTSRYLIPASEIETRLGGEWTKEWVLGWRDICRSVDQRTLISSLIPRAAFGGFHQIRIYAAPKECATVYACLCSFIVDYVARQKVGGTHVTYGILEQLPIIEPEAVAAKLVWEESSSVSDWMLPRVLELTYTAWDLEPFGRDVGYNGPPFRWNPDRRHLLRCEIDAAFFRLYGLSRDDVDYVMGSFPIVRKNDEKEHGEYRTKRVILEIYDAMAEAERTGKGYQTGLNPPPADPRVAHPARVPTLPTMPTVIPHLPPAEEAAFVIWALLYAADGTLTRTDLARAYALRERPDLLRRFAPSSLSQASEWATKIGARSVAQGLFASTVRTLSDRNGLVLGVNAKSQSTVSTGPSAPAEELLEPWFRFEARLALQVLRALPATAFEVVDNSFSGDDRALLERAS